MRYLRRRRLSEAARQLSAGADDILSLALDAGYNSHEVFTRAFKGHLQLHQSGSAPVECSTD